MFQKESLLRMPDAVQLPTPRATAILKGDDKMVEEVGGGGGDGGGDGGSGGGGGGDGDDEGVTPTEEELQGSPPQGLPQCRSPSVDAPSTPGLAQESGLGSDKVQEPCELGRRRGFIFASGGKSERVVHAIEKPLLSGRPTAKGKGGAETTPSEQSRSSSKRPRSSSEEGAIASDLGKKMGRSSKIPPTIIRREVYELTDLQLYSDLLRHRNLTVDEILDARAKLGVARACEQGEITRIVDTIAARKKWMEVLVEVADRKFKEAMEMERGN